MRHWMRIGLGCVGVAALLAAVPALAAQPHGRASDRPRALFVANHGLFVKATQGSFCASNGNSNLCGDFAYPLPVHGHLPVRREDRITIDTHDKTVKRLHAQLLRVKGTNANDAGQLRHLHRVAKHPRLWRIRLPHRLHGANTIDVFLRYKNGGDADYWAGIKPGG